MLFYGIISLTRMVTLTMISSFEQPTFSPFADLYDILIPQDNFWRKLHDIDFSFIIDSLQDQYTLSYGRKAVDPIRLFKMILLKIPQDNFWRKLHDIDFSFIIDSLQDQYTLSYGRKAVDPIRLFKMILLKNHHKLSDRDLVHKCRVDMEMKFFLDYAPEETSLIDPSLLSKFRTMRLADTNVLDLLIAKTMEMKFFLDYAPEETSLIDPSLLSKFRTMRLADTNVLDLLIAKTVEIGLEKGVIASKNKLIVDATHTTARFQPVSIREEILNRCRDLRKSVYAHDQTMHDKMPLKRKTSSGIVEDVLEYCQEVVDVKSVYAHDQTMHDKMPLKRKTSSGIVEDVLEYCQEVVDVIESEKKYDALPNVQERMNYLKEAIEKRKTSSGIVEDVLEYCQEVVDVIESEKKYDALPNVQERMNYLKEAIEETQTRKHRPNCSIRKIRMRRLDTRARTVPFSDTRRTSP